MVEQIRRGVVTVDPAQISTPGTSLDIQFMFFPPIAPKGFGDLAEWDYFGTALIGLSFRSADRLRPDGSAVLIGPGIAFAAKHVFDPIMDDIMASRITPLAYSITPEGMVIWSIHQIIQAENDVIILRLNLASSFPPSGLHCATLTTRTPQVDESVMIVGIRGDGEVLHGKKMEIMVNIAVGQVTKVYETSRDRLLLPHPCVEVFCPSVGA